MLRRVHLIFKTHLDVGFTDLACNVVCYSFYTISPEVEEKLGTRHLFVTIPFVLYGIFRYLYLVHQKGQGGNPASSLLTDRPLLICVGLWSLVVAAILYF